MLSSDLSRGRKEQWVGGGLQEDIKLTTLQMVMYQTIGSIT